MKQQINVSEQDKFVLGVKLEYLRRAVTHFSLKPSRPIPIPGITKQIAAFVVGRNIKHRMYVIVQDFFGNRAKLYHGRTQAQRMEHADRQYYFRSKKPSPNAKGSRITS
jgi:hypothetical protein